MVRVAFYKGRKKFYDKKKHQDAIYFAPDTKEILVNDVSYGVSTEWESKILQSVRKIKKDDTALADFEITDNKGVTYKLSFSDDIKGAINTSAADTIATITKTIEEKEKSLSENIKSSEIEFDSENKRINLTFWDGTTSTGFDASPFIKDGMLKDVQYREEVEEYILYDENGDPRKDLNGNIIKDKFEEVPFLRFEFNEDWAKANNRQLKQNIIRIPVNKLIDIYTGDGAIDIDSNRVITLTPEFLNSLGVQQVNENWEFVWIGEGTKYISEATSLGDALLKLDKEIQKINATDVGTVSVTDTWIRDDETEPTRNKYVTVELEQTGEESKYIVKENLDIDLLGWEDFDIID